MSEDDDIRFAERALAIEAFQHEPQQSGARISRYKNAGLRHARYCFLKTSRDFTQIEVVQPYGLMGPSPVKSMRAKPARFKAS